MALCGSLYQFEIKSGYQIENGKFLYYGCNGVADDMTDDEVLDWMNISVRHEQYEQAALCRDELRRRKFLRLNITL